MLSKPCRRAGRSTFRRFPDAARCCSAFAIPDRESRWTSGTGSSNPGPRRARNMASAWVWLLHVRLRSITAARYGRSLPEGAHLLSSVFLELGPLHVDFAAQKCAATLKHRLERDTGAALTLGIAFAAAAQRRCPKPAGLGSADGQSSLGSNQTPMPYTADVYSPQEWMVLSEPVRVKRCRVRPLHANGRTGVRRSRQG